KLSGYAAAVTALTVLLLAPSWLTQWKASISLVEGTAFEDNKRWPEAKASYLKAVELDPACADAYAGLARAALQGDPQGHSAADISEWRTNLYEALRWKKSVRFLAELEHPNP